MVCRFWNCFSYHDGPAVLGRLLVCARRRNMGGEHPGWLGIRHCQFCLVDWNRPRRNADFRDSSFIAAVLAEFHQPIRRSHDAVRCGLRRNVSRAPSWASLASVLAVPYPNTMKVWPQFRSPLVWDVFAVSTYATISLLFWFI